MILEDFKLPENGFKNEAEFTTWFGKQIIKMGGFFHKISDYSPGYKPFDAIFALKERAGVIEFKAIAGKSCCPFDLLRGSSPKNPGTQVKGLTDYDNNGGFSYVIVYSKATNTYKVIQWFCVNKGDRISFT